jgi:hypothetical protein
MMGVLRRRDFGYTEMFRDKQELAEGRIWGRGLAVGLAWAWCGLGFGQVAPEDGAKLDGRVWVGMVFASAAGGAGPGEVVEMGAEEEALFEGLKGRLGRAYERAGLVEFALLGSHEQDLYRAYESWLVPSEAFFVKIDSGGWRGDELRVHVQLWHEKDVLVKTDAMLGRDRPVLISGPAWRGGRLVFAVVLR